MAAYTRSNPTAVAINTLQKTFQQTIFKYVLSGSGTASALDATTATPVTDEIGTTSSIFQVKTGGLQIVTIGDNHALDINTLAIRVGRIIGTGSLTAAGVWTFTDSTTLTVTAPTSVFGL